MILLHCTQNLTHLQAFGAPKQSSHVAITGAVGRRVVITALVIREYFVQPSLVRNAL